MLYSPFQLEMKAAAPELGSCVKVEVDILGSPSLITYGFCGRKATLNERRLRQSSGEIKNREVELGSHSWMDCLAAGLFLASWMLSL